ncbi:MAG: helix-turn-helix transcriptional regulator [Clostridia bacterium]|nr:helix-turn-helix transcriptional regulator [Clostridia bacterium]
MINFKAIGQRIKLQRKKKNLTQEKLAEMLDVSTEHLSRIETGSYRPSLSLIERICEIFKIEELELMFGDRSNIETNRELYEKIESLSEDKKKAVLMIIELIE